MLNITHPISTYLYRSIVPLFPILLLTISNNLKAVENTDSTFHEPEIVATSFVSEHQIYIKWAPTNFETWTKGNRYGYTVERLEFNNTKDNYEYLGKATISDAPFKPLPLNQWEKLSEQNDYCAIMAQAIYGSSFNGNLGESTSIINIVNFSSENQQRYAFAMTAAELDFTSTQHAGLGFIDSTYQKEYQYLYKIYLETPDSTASDTALVLVKPSTPNHLPIPFEFKAHTKHTHVLLNWNYLALSKIFSAYNIYRAEKGKPFQRINQKPFLLLNPNAKENSGQAVYGDSIAQKKKYQYYIKGINAFGMEGPASEMVTVKANSPQLSTPIITHKQSTLDGKATISWTFPKKEEQYLDRFAILHSSHPDAGFQLLTTVPKRKRNTSFALQPNSNYLIVRAYNQSNQFSQTLPLFLQLPDRQPPIQPAQPFGSIDSLGVVHLQWAANFEADLMGYLVFRKFHKSEEFQPLIQEVQTENHFYDTLSLASLNKEVYYMVKAVDRHYNESQASLPLVLTKPDTIAPAPPSFKSYEIKNGIQLTWNKSSSNDVAKYLVERKASGHNNWTNLHNTQATESFYTDLKAIQHQNYHYRIVAIDNAGLRSRNNQEIKIHVPYTGKPSGIYAFTATYNEREQHSLLSWECKEPNIRFFELFRIDKNGKTAFLKQLPADTMQFCDLGIIPFDPYEYMIRACYTNGRVSLTTTTFLNE